MASPMTEFVKIGPRTSLFVPPKPASGQLIIICTWLGAARKHIVKYISLYQAIAPSARILLIESNVPILISSYVKQRRDIKPAVAAVLDTLTSRSPTLFPSGTLSKTATDRQHAVNTGSSGSNSDSTNPRILLHVFSNGGTNTATQLLIVLNAHLKAPLRLAGLLCDSCPAKGTYWRSYDAMVLSLPKDLASRMLGALVCHCILILLYTWIACGNENPASLNRRTMLDEGTVSACWGEEGEGNKGGGTVCYLYSKEDRMCLWEDVTAHASEARRLGWDVREILFEGSGHCAHLQRDEGRYGDAVWSVWDDGSERGRRGMSKL